MIKLQRALIGIALSGLVAGCTAIYPSADAPFLTAQDLAAQPAPFFPSTITTGDQLEIRFYPNSTLRAEAYRIEPGDIVRVDVADQPDLNRDNVNVLPDGSISLPLIGRVRIAGRSPEQASQDVSRLYARRGIKDALAVVSVTQDQRRLRLLFDTITRQTGGNTIQFRIHDGENIQLPFIAEVPSNQSLEAIRRQIRDAYHREFGGQVEVTTNLVQRDGLQYYVMGEVQRPGSYPLTPATTVLAAVASAGGFLSTADPSSALLIRFDPAGVYKYWQVDLKQALATPGDAAARFPLQRKDVIYVARSPIANVNLFVEQYIRKVIPLDMNFGLSYELNRSGNN